MDCTGDQQAPRHVKISRERSRHTSPVTTYVRPRSQNESDDEMIDSVTDSRQTFDEISFLYCPWPLQDTV